MREVQGALPLEGFPDRCKTQVSDSLGDSLAALRCLQRSCRAYEIYTDKGLAPVAQHLLEHDTDAYLSVAAGLNPIYHFWEVRFHSTRVKVTFNEYESLLKSDEQKELPSQLIKRMRSIGGREEGSDVEVFSFRDWFNVCGWPNRDRLLELLDRNLGKVEESCSTSPPAASQWWNMNPPQNELILAVVLHIRRKSGKASYAVDSRVGFH
ncbi:hypothetical protein V3481_002148 [Fusarium oxysporum f. sp. vasinfectum]